MCASFPSTRHHGYSVHWIFDLIINGLKIFINFPRSPFFFCGESLISPNVFSNQEMHTSSTYNGKTCAFAFVYMEMWISTYLDYRLSRGKIELYSIWLTTAGYLFLYLNGSVGPVLLSVQTLGSLSKKENYLLIKSARELKKVGYFCGVKDKRAMVIHLYYFLNRCLYFAFVLLFLGVASFSQPVHWLLGRHVCTHIAVQIHTNSLWRLLFHHL